MGLPPTPTKSPTSPNDVPTPANSANLLTPTSVVPGEPSASPIPSAAGDDADSEGTSERSTSERADNDDLNRAISSYCAGTEKYNKTILAYLAKSSHFQNTTLMVIVINAVWICVETEWNHSALEDQAGKLPLQPLSNYVEQAFCFFFTGELLIRFLAFRRKLDCFFDAWFVFDSSLVSFMVLETWIIPIVALVSQAESGGGFSLSSLSSFRLLRLLRLTRMARIMAFFPELLILVKGLVRAFKTVIWIVGMLVLITYVFAIVFTSQVAEPGMCPEWPSDDSDGVQLANISANVSAGSEEEADITDGQRMFCTLFSSIMTLFTMGVLGDDLHPALMAIKDTALPDNRNMSLLLMWLFVIFLVISFITLLNMLIGVLCEVIQETSDKEEEDNSRIRLEQALVHAFRQADKSNDAKISEDEWLQMARDPSVVDTLTKLGVDEGSLPEKLAQMQETLFGSRSKGLTSAPTSTRSSASIVKRKKTIGFSEFEEKVKELTWKRPASALDMKMLESSTKDWTLAMKKKLAKMEDNLKIYKSKPRGSRGASAASKTAPAKSTADAAYPKVPAAKPSPNTANAWIQEVPSDMLMHILKTRSPEAGLAPPSTSMAKGQNLLN